ncbi:MAG: ABC-F family ATP-binding cassette domain-containing protein [Sphingomonadales bacterium]|jgi:ATP-binding cassette subfamily F protein 3|uniref:ABC-F family ATP-binding cassette domain-containing protein n=1 Tax=Sphingomonas sp. TaxID=28214 RepID=UPI0010D72E2D|nr:ABC-F family ATP-binding cassette domain-containing protein [Sphingomonas sp.]RYD67572.1 MAG: ABC-F family ATP-binding cassette domain-containing protein [Sphingomonadales bacterium]HEV7290611.1 ABC-F family ATP-binding cassette domain-containing protein [Sphingomonas sp.]
MLNLSGITVRLGGRVIIDRASAALPPKGRIGLIGRNGAGKSTLVKVIAGMIDPDEGSADMPRGARLGYVAQEAPAGKTTPFETVLEADVERAALMAEAEGLEDPHRLGEIHERLGAIDAYTAPSRAARILVGLGFDEEAQHRPLDSFSGGWRMRVALAALLFSQPDLLLLDEPSNHLDLEAVLWLEDFLISYPATIVIVSHERDFLNNVVDHILHLERGKLTLYPGGYDAFERQRAERQAQQAAAREKQLTERAKLQDFVARNSARASTAKQAQSRAKALAKMQPIAAVMDDPTLAFGFPDPDQLRPPLITLDHASVGYDGTPILSRLNLRIDPDDRIALLGRNGNGKTTLARLLAAQLTPIEGEKAASAKMRVGYFTQYQVEELHSDETPFDHMQRLMDGEKPSAVRGQLGRFGFAGDKAMTKVGKLSGGERARLALALITRDAPHMLILDEPTNHLDVDSREALIQALTAYQGCVVIVSHDRHMIEMTADRLVLVDGGTATPFDGSIEDYIAFVLAKEPKAEGAAKGGNRKDARREAAEAREKGNAMRKAAKAAEAELAKLQEKLSAIDRAMFDPSSAAPEFTKLTMTELMKQRGAVVKAIEAAEVTWMEAQEALETLAA